jgi:hypothetical protein
VVGEITMKPAAFVAFVAPRRAERGSASQLVSWRCRSAPGATAEIAAVKNVDGLIEKCPVEIYKYNGGPQYIIETILFKINL